MSSQSTAKLTDKGFLDSLSPKEEEHKEKLLLAGFTSEQAKALAKIFESARDLSPLEYLLLRADMEVLEKKLCDPTML